MPAHTPASSNGLNGTHNGHEDSEDSVPDGSMTQLEEIGPDEFPLYFSELNDRLFPSDFVASTPYPFPVDTPEQDVSY